MHLRRLTLQGFKTFANKTSLTFPAGKADHHALTIVVGPNGSGKSNIADAIRWCLGEQSMKQLRGKNSQDVIFSGSDGKGRSNMAEVSLEFDNPNNIGGMDLSEIVITRRLYRDGESNYMLNGKNVRLADIQMLLAEAGIGQRTYTVIAQGMIDHILTSSPEERKVFFDDATGVRGLQMKRHQSMSKLRRSTEMMVEAERLLKEIEPRLKMLQRQVKRLEEREEVETALKEIQELYYGAVWQEQEVDLGKFKHQITTIDQRIEAIQATIKAGDEQLAKIEAQQEQEALVQADKGQSERAKLQQEYSKAQRSYREAQQHIYEAERNLEIQKVRAQSKWSPLPLKEIVAELDAMLSKGDSITVSDLYKLIKSLKTKLTKPKPEDIQLDPVLVDQVEKAKSAASEAKSRVEVLEEALTKAAKETAQPNQVNKEVFRLQRELREAQSQLHTEETKKNQLLIEKTRVDTRREDLLAELKELNLSLNPNAKDDQSRSTHLLKEKMGQLQRKKEMIGGIDDEVIAEHKETSERHRFLTEQLDDLREAIKHSEGVIDELDDEIREQSEEAFESINEKFQLYFKVLFGGGSCSLIKLKKDEEDEGTDVTPERGIHELIDGIEAELSESEEILKRFEERKDTVAGIDIQATPPGKKLKSLHSLSGGERALTSIALLSAIMATNPSPFVVLDEVDAALDEANTVRFANILGELQKLTQFIVVTHNRATMERGDLLYGVTMGDDGISNLLSVSMEEVEKNVTNRR